MIPERVNEWAVVLAASYPPREYKSKADSHEIAAAVKAFIGAVFHKGWRILFGGHPTISPLVLMIAREYGRRGSVTIFQSAYFKNHPGAATQSLAAEHFGRIVLIPNDPAEPIPKRDELADPTKCPKSLSAMRGAMLSEPNIVGLVLIGGDTGLGEELALFRTIMPKRPVIPIAAPGGIASELLDRAHTPEMDERLRTALNGSRNYTFLCARIVNYLNETVTRM